MSIISIKICCEIKQTLSCIILEFVLYDLNRTVNEEIGREVHDFHKLIPNNEENVVISYRNVRLFFKYIIHKENDI